jgi:hypothetical protein
MRFVKITNNVVENIIEADAVWSSSQADIYLPSEIANVGWIVKDGELVPPTIEPCSEVEKH